MKTSLLLVATLTLSATAQQITAPHASLVDVPTRQAYLAHTTDPLLRATIKSLKSCVNTPLVPAPTGRIDIPHHYLSGNNGPINPAEAPVTRVYSDYEHRITAGMNQYVATGSHAESACALAQIDAWAKAGALLDYDPKESSQAWDQVEWTLGSSAITDSVLVNDSTLDPATQKRVAVWLNTAAHKLIGFEKPGQYGNNHYYFRALDAAVAGIITSDNQLFQFAIDTYKEAISEIDTAGAFPREMARHENAVHYQGFALQPLILIAEFAARQGTDLYSYQSHGHTIRDAILFYGRAAADPSLVKPYASETQNIGTSDFAPYPFYVARFGTEGLPPAIVSSLQHPLDANRIGGYTTLLAAQPLAAK